MVRILAVAIAACVCVAACSSSAKQTLNQAGARAAAETARAVLKSQNLKQGETVRSVSVLKAAADKVPGSPDVTGITDANGDGKDDDGKVEFTVGDQHACLTAHDNGSVDVTDGTC
jgi:hypothetical protein